MKIALLLLSKYIFNSFAKKKKNWENLKKLIIADI